MVLLNKKFGLSMDFNLNKLAISPWVVKDKRLLIPAGLLLFFLIIGIVFNVANKSDQNFVYQADGFLHGTVFYHTLPSDLKDSSAVGDKYYWAPGPLPAIILIPLVAIGGLGPYQMFINLALMLVVLVLSYLISRQEKYNQADSIWLAIAFTFASVYLGVVYQPQAWQVSSALAVAAALYMIYKYRQRAGPTVIGVAAAAALATRVTAGLVFLVPLLGAVLDREINNKNKLLWLGKFLLPIGIVVSLLLCLNFARTGNWLDVGYKTARVAPPLAATRQVTGLFSINR